MRKESIAIIIVTFNSGKYIFNCLNSIISNFTSDYIYKIVVIDNNSQDDTVDIVESLARNNLNIQLILESENLGFAKATNLGLKATKESKYFLLLNPDTVANTTSITNLILCIKENKAGIVGGSTFNKVGAQNGSYFRLPNLLVGLLDFTNLRKITPSDYWHKYFYYLDDDFSRLTNFSVEVVTGGYMLISKETIIKVGYFDERYFMYLEDVDYCLRAKQANIRVAHCNNASIVHFSGGSSGNKDGINHSAWLWSRKKYFLKHFSLISNIIIQPVFLIDDLYILFRRFISK